MNDRILHQIFLLSTIPFHSFSTHFKHAPLFFRLNERERKDQVVAPPHHKRNGYSLYGGDDAVVRYCTLRSLSTFLLHI